MVGGYGKKYEHNICLLNNRQLLGKRQSLGLPCVLSSVSTGNEGAQFRARRRCLARVRRINVIIEYHRVEPLDGGVNLVSVFIRQRKLDKGSHAFNGPGYVVFEHSKQRKLEGTHRVPC